MTNRRGARGYPRTSRVARIVAIGGVLAACLEPHEPTPAEVAASLAIRPPEETAGLPGRTLGLSATVRDSLGREVPGLPLVWSATPPERATVAGDGTVTFGPGTGAVSVIVQQPASGLADTVELRAAREGEIRWARRLVDVDSAYFTSVGGPAIAPNGDAWFLLLRSPDFTPADAITGVLVRMTASGREVCRVILPQAENNGTAIPDDGRGVWVFGQRLYRVSDACAIEATYQTAAPTAFSAGGAVGPADSLYVVASHLLALGPDFSERWRGTLTGGWVKPPTLRGPLLVVKRYTDSLFALDAATGAVRWTAPDLDGPPDVATAHSTGVVLVGNRLYVPSRRSLSAYDTLGALQWRVGPFGVGVSEPVVSADGSRLFVQRQFGLTAYDTAGRELWNMSSGTPQWYGLYGGPALAEGDVIYAATRDGFRAYRSTSQLLWTTATAPGDSAWFLGSPAIGPDGTIFTWGDRFAYALFGSLPPAAASPWNHWRGDPQRRGRGKP